MIKKSIAFTLAESLLVMAVIGVVATLVVPNLKNNSDDQVYVSRAKKMFTELDTAFSRATLKYGSNTKSWTVSQYYDRLGEFLNTKKSCTKDDDSCIQYTQGCTNDYMILKDGSSFCVLGFNGVYIPKYGGTAIPIFIDVDGPAKGNNKIGKDMFALSVMRSQDLREPSVLLDYFPLTVLIENGIASGKSPNPMTYFHWIMEYGNMDFKKCTVQWETKTTCN